MASLKLALAHFKVSYETYKLAVKNFNISQDICISWDWLQQAADDGWMDGSKDI